MRLEISCELLRRYLYKVSSNQLGKHSTYVTHLLSNLGSTQKYLYPIVQKSFFSKTYQTKCQTCSEICNYISVPIPTKDISFDFQNKVEQFS